MLLAAGISVTPTMLPLLNLSYGGSRSLGLGPLQAVVAMKKNVYYLYVEESTMLGCKLIAKPGLAIC